MDNIQTLIAKKDYALLSQACERIELQMATGTSGNGDLQQIYAVLLIVYAIVDDLNSARFLRKRILGHGTPTAEIDVAWRVCVILWERRYPDIYEVLAAHAWSPLLSPLVQDLRDTLRNRLGKVLQKAFTNIDLATASRYFGMPEADLVPALAAQEWSFDTSSRMFTPPPVAMAPPHNRPQVDQMSRLSSVLLRFEQC